MLCNLFGHIKTLFYYRLFFRKIGKGSLIIKPLKIDNPKAIEIGEKTYIGHYSWLMGSSSMGTTLRIGNNVQVGHYAHIVAMSDVFIEDAVLLADKVFISDCSHSYEDVQIPILNQLVKVLKKVRIGEGSWLGENVCVCGASIGKHCVIGANSVVTNDIPDYCVAAGSPAKVVKKYDFEKKQWVRI